MTTLLHTYLTERGIDRDEFAARIGVHAVSVWRFCNGKARPSLETAVRIERATDGAVPAISWVADADELEPGTIVEFSTARTSSGGSV